jgi:hypothetical protein
VIDAVFIPIDQTWCVLYTEQRNGHAFIWQQKFRFTNQLENKATQVGDEIVNIYFIFEV